MPENRLEVERTAGEQGIYGQQMPLHARLELVEDAIDYLHGRGPGGRASVVLWQIRDYLHLYRIFVQYLVHHRVVV